MGRRCAGAPALGRRGTVRWCRARGGGVSRGRVGFAARACAVPRPCAGRLCAVHPCAVHPYAVQRPCPVRPCAVRPLPCALMRCSPPSYVPMRCAPMHCAHTCPRCACWRSTCCEVWCAGTPCGVRCVCGHVLCAGALCACALCVHAMCAGRAAVSVGRRDGMRGALCVCARCVTLRSELLRCVLVLCTRCDVSPRHTMRRLLRLYVPALRTPACTCCAFGVTVQFCCRPATVGAPRTQRWPTSWACPRAACRCASTARLGSQNQICDTA